MPVAMAEVMTKPPEQPWALASRQVIERFNTDPELGLGEKEARRRLRHYGENRLPDAESKSLLRIFLEQFLDPVIYVLVAATALAFFLGEWIEGTAVLIVILITVLIGFLMEWQALRSIEALRKIAQTVSMVIRNGEPVEVKDTRIVPGDLILLEAGDVVPADGRVIEHENLAVKEASLTGESAQTGKSTDLLPEDTILAERRNMIFKGTLVTRGAAKAVVTATGERTEFGKIARLTESARDEITPLKKKLNRLSHHLIWLTLAMAVLIAATGYLQGKPLALMIETAIALAVATIPEGLPIVATIALARGMLRLARDRVIIKKLQAVQTLGETSIICTDKTGTLTENQMAVQKLLLADKMIDFSPGSNPEDPSQWINDPDLSRMLQVCALCNNAKPDDDSAHGDPIEVALVQLVQLAGIDIDQLRETFPEVVEHPFDTETKMMATLNRDGDNFLVCAKGALENILKRCTAVRSNGISHPIADRQAWVEKANQLAAGGLRTLALAYRISDRRLHEEDLLHDLVLLGLVGFIDPPRKDVRPAIDVCRKAGIRVVMVTGDHPETARRIAEETGLLDRNASSDKIIHGRELALSETLSDEQQKSLLDKIVFARVTPSQKLDLVDFYQQHGYIVGMTGDGINDAPALKKADIGIAMGIRGTEAAREVADVILRDDQFTSIELAIRQGRIIFENIRKFVVYLLSSNFAEIFAVTIASLAALPLPLLPLQILYLNLVTDIFPALALGMGKGEKDIMDYPPRPADEPIMPRRFWTATLIYGLGITAGVIGITAYAALGLALPGDQVNNLAFYTLVLAQLLNVFNLPKNNISFFRNEITKNPWVWGAIVLCIMLTGMGYFIPVLREVLSLVPLTMEQLGLVGVFAVGSLILTQLIKRLF